MDILCFLVEPTVCLTQFILDLAWFPLSFLGFSAPSVGGIVGPFLGCSF